MDARTDRTLALLCGERACAWSIAATCLTLCALLAGGLEKASAQTSTSSAGAAASAIAQAPAASAPTAAPPIQTNPAPNSPATVPTPTAGPAITLEQAFARAQANEPLFRSAVAASKAAALDRSIARSLLLPQVDYHNQVLYTQPNHLRTAAGTSPSGQTGVVGQADAPIFIANNAVREYASQGIVTETVGFGLLADVARASAAQAIAQAELEISRRGLTATVIGLFYATMTTQQKVSVAERALDEASSFVKLTSQREAQRESAHADVIKAQLSQQQRQRDFADAQLMAAKARIDLGVLLFPDPRTPYTTVIPADRTLPARAEIEARAYTNNPELRSALSTLRARDLDIRAARAAYLPNLATSFYYGVDAEQFAVTGSNGARNLGYAAGATLDIPIFDWFATQHRIRQAQIFRDAATVNFSAAQRTLIARLDEDYAEAELASQQLASLQVSVDTAQESLRLTRLRYSVSEATVLEVVDAQNSLTLTETGLTDGTTRYQVALANLELLTGTI